MIGLPPSRLLLSGALLCTSCVKPDPIPKQSVVVSLVPPDHASSLDRVDAGILWGLDKDFQKKSYWIRQTASGLRITKEAPGTFIRTSSGTWEWRTEPISLKTEPCRMNGSITSPPGKGDGTRGFFRDIEKNKEQEVVHPDIPNVNEARHDLLLVASAGPYVFIRESSYVHDCGTHGYVTESLKIWDLNQAKLVEMDGKETSFRPSQDHLLQAQQAFYDMDRESEKHPTNWIATIPRFPGDTMIAHYVFTTWACYTCGSNDWGSYTYSTIIPGPVPEILQPYSQTPDWVLSFLADHPDFDLHGWSS